MRFIVFIAVWGISWGLPDTVKSQDNSGVLNKKLCNAGFENIRCLTRDNRILITAENNIYRWKTDAIKTILDTAATCLNPESQISLYILKNDIPQLQIKVPAKIWTGYRSGKIKETELADALRVDYGIDEDWKFVKSSVASNPNVNKIDLVIYPQLVIQNRLLTRLYEIQFNIAPAIEVSLWKGMLFTGQIIFPLKNDLEIMDIKENEDYKNRNYLYTSSEGDYIRPGFITLSQDIRLPQQWFINLTVGNFNTHRYGVNGHVVHFFKGTQWSIAANTGLTGSSHFYHGQLVTGSLNVFTWQITAGYYYPRLNLQCDLSYGSYLNNDKGVRTDFNRHFGSVNIGFYAMYTGSDFNGGFKFTVPFPFARQGRKHFIRVKTPNFFDSDYNAGYAVYYGKEYEIRPNENQTEYFNNPSFIREYLIK